VRLAVLTLLALCHQYLAVAAQKPATPPLEFAQEYARQLVSLEEVRARGEADLRGTDDDNGKLSSGIHFSTLMQLELRSEIHMLHGMRLTGQFAELIPGIVALGKQKIDLHQQFIDLVTAILGGPKPGVDYGKVVAQIPQVRAQLEDIDHTIFADVTPLACMTLLDPHPDSRNQVSHLTITRVQKAELIRILVDGFGQNFQDSHGNKTFTVSSGLVMKAFLEGHLASDDQWD
jgi:hypothetical protein